MNVFNVSMVLRFRARAHKYPPHLIRGRGLNIDTLYETNETYGTLISFIIIMFITL